jgi:hypothetical protein
MLQDSVIGLPPRDEAHHTEKKQEISTRGPSTGKNKKSREGG